MRVTIELLDERLSRRIGLAEGVGGWLHPRGVARHDDCRRHVCDGSGAQRAATSTT